jgi:C4-dicarboxylate-specific signal transduction histidine kinase
MTRSVDSEECTNPHPLSMQSSAFRVKRQAIVGTFLVLGLVAAASSIYLAMQLAALSAAQDVNVQLLKEHETLLSVNERSIALINSTVLRMGKKVAELSNTLGTDKLILQLGFTLDSVFEDSTRILRGMNALADNRLSPDFVKTSKMTAALLRLENSMRREGYKLGLETFDDIYRCQTITLVWNKWNT